MSGYGEIANILAKQQKEVSVEKDNIEEVEQLVNNKPVSSLQGSASSKKTAQEILELMKGASAAKKPSPT